jgi:sugar phosphate permease
VEYHWHGFQLLWGNAYIIAGVALLVIALCIGFRLRNRPRAAEAAEQQPLAATI